MRSQLSAARSESAACKTAIADADRAFSTEADALGAISSSDFASADTYTSLFGTELDEYRSAKDECTSKTTSV